MLAKKSFIRKGKAYLSVLLAVLILTATSLVFMSGCGNNDTGTSAKESSKTSRQTANTPWNAETAKANIDIILNKYYETNPIKSSGVSNLEVTDVYFLEKKNEHGSYNNMIIYLVSYKIKSRYSNHVSQEYCDYELHDTYLNGNDLGYYTVNLGISRNDKNKVEEFSKNLNSTGYTKTKIY